MFRTIFKIAAVSCIVAMSINASAVDSPQTHTIEANGQILAAKDYQPLIMTYRNAAPVVLSDVARVVDDAENLAQAA